MDIPWDLLGGGGVGAVATLAILTPLLRKRNGCPVPGHAEMLARHDEAIDTLKQGQHAIFKKLDDLPEQIARAMKAKGH